MSHLLDAERRRQAGTGVGAPTTFVLSQGKRSIDLVAAAGLFDELPLDLVRKILIEGGVLQFDQLASINRSTADTINAAIHSDGFFRELTKHCFPATTRLPFDAQHLLDSGYIVNENEAWRAHLARLVELLRRMSVRLVNTMGRGIEVRIVDIEQPSTCSELTAESRLDMPLDTVGLRYLLVFGSAGDRSIVVQRNDQQDLGAWTQVVSLAPAQLINRLFIDPAKLTDNDVDALIAVTARFVAVPLHVPLNPSVYVEWKPMFGAEPKGVERVARRTRLGDLFYASFHYGLLRYQYGAKKVLINISRQPMLATPAPNSATLKDVLPPDVDRVEVLYKPLP